MKETIKWLLITLVAVWAGKTLPVTTLAGQYLRGLIQLAKVSVLVPIPFALIGIANGWLWLTACAGLWCTAFLTILLVWGSPLGVIIDSLLKWNSGGVLSVSGERYITLARGVLLWEALTYWLLSIVPIRNHWELVPLAILSVVCLVLMAYHWQRDSKWTRPVFWYSCLGLVGVMMVAFFFPKLTPSNTLTATWGGLENAWRWLEPRITLASIGIFILVRVVYWLYINKKQGSSTVACNAPTSSHGGHSSSHSGGGLTTIVGWAFILFVVWMVVTLFMLGREQAERRNIGQWSAQKSMGAGIPREHWVTAPVGAEVPVFLPSGMTVDTLLANSSETVWVRPAGNPRFLYWNGKTNLSPARVFGDIQVFYESGTNHPVVVKVSIRPNS